MNEKIKSHDINLEDVVIYIKKYVYLEKNKCDICGEEYVLINVGNNASICMKCLEDFTRACDFCLERHVDDDINREGLSTVDEDGDTYICEECIEDEKNGVVRCECEWCNHPVVWKSSATDKGDMYDTYWICNNCIDGCEEIHDDPEIDDKDDLEDWYEDLWEQE